MKAKSLGIFVLSILLILGLLQIDAIGNLHPIFHSIAVSIHRMVNWVIDAHSGETQRIILTGEQGFINSDGPRDNSSIFVKKPIDSVRNADGVELENQANVGDFGYIPLETPTDESESRKFLLLQEIVEPDDPVTDLFPETEWYDEIDSEDYDFADLLTAEEEGEIPLDNAVNSDLVQPLLDEIKAQIQQKLEYPESEATQE
jgi:hypothetical protein